MKIYRCTYEHQGLLLTVESRFLICIKDGFFIDKTLEITHDSDRSTFWIPPSQIKHVKIEERGGRN